MCQLPATRRVLRLQYQTELGWTEQEEREWCRRLSDHLIRPSHAGSPASAATVAVEQNTSEQNRTCTTSASSDIDNGWAKLCGRCLEEF